MPPTYQPPFDGDDFDPAALLWSPGIDYVRGWREATDAAAELFDALRTAGIDTTTITTRADTSPDGTGVVRLALPVSTARGLVALAKVAARRVRRASRSILKSVMSRSVGFTLGRPCTTQGRRSPAWLAR